MSSKQLYQTRRKLSKYSRHSPKATIKFLSTCADPRVQRVVLNSANDSVYKSICNAFFNLAENPEIKLSPKHKKLLNSYNPRIRNIISNKFSIRKKRSAIQKGGAAFLGTILPIVLSSALSLLGSTFLSKKR